MVVLETVPNVSEGRDRERVVRLASALAGPMAVPLDAPGPGLLDLHSDPDHHRSVFTAAGSPSQVEGGILALARACIEEIDLRHHDGRHPRLGALDVVPIVPLDPGEEEEDDAHKLAAQLAKQFIALGLGVFRFGQGARPLSEVRAAARSGSHPELGAWHPTAGAVCLGVRSPLVAFNVDLSATVTEDECKAVAATVRGPTLQALGMRLSRQGRVQVSMNLVDPSALGLEVAWRRVGEACADEGLPSPVGAELVGLAPRAALAGMSPEVARMTGAASKVLEDHLQDRR